MTVPAIITVTEGVADKKPLALGTKDISSGGGFFPCEEPFNVDTRVEVGFLIPFSGVEGSEGSGAHVKISGVVVRTDTEGMAIQFDNGYVMKPFS